MFSFIICEIGTFVPSMAVLFTEGTAGFIITILSYVSRLCTVVTYFVTFGFYLTSIRRVVLTLTENTLSAVVVGKGIKPAAIAPKNKIA